MFSNPLERLRADSSAKVPILVGNTENDESLLEVGMSNLTAFLEGTLPRATISPDFVRSLYPGENDTVVISHSLRDLTFKCPVELWSAAIIGRGSNVFRYTYGAVFEDLQIFAGAGAWHGSELGPLFGTFNRSTATQAEITWTNTFQRTIANFIKNPDNSPAINWPKYIAGPSAKTLAKLAYHENVQINNFVESVTSASLDGPCDALWDQFLDLA
ncbi:Carboxylic ester hydrolase [Mycena venus]|uniref:Carboxylic ester hydrolase n=1 Tax=Mycena venus TaxID=2733690 RepID=A0A8H6YGA0_9AGAR|nr:Carboxylic ester hydrolase [Mycena venus]